MSSIAGAAFLADPALSAVFDAVAGRGEALRVVGGAVRNSLLGEPVADVDLATTALPDEVMARAAAAGIKAVPTGLAHGTVTLVSAGHPFEVTTLRSDVETFGRHATVAFGRDWAADAARRDFTMNAVYAERDGQLVDLVGGLADIAARRVRFIGDPDRRIAEDHLRILRYFRFHARYGDGWPQGPDLDACRRGRDGLRQLSRERVRAELAKILAAPGAEAALAAMAEAGLLADVLGGAADVAAFARLRRLAREAGVEVDFALALGALTDGDPALADRLRLTVAERTRLAALVRLAPAVAAMAAPEVRAAVYGEGNATVAGALLIAAARRGGGLPETVAVALAFDAPKFPLRAADLIAEGWRPGRDLGAELRRREAEWVAAGFPSA